ncbi:uncharacterized protein AMSG_03739 [Thecamonas trahens ATCC 50062]|uniref:PX domain-containing protein n=1 Tax=Thecamonas trahens ATCC 50062 TaxID=461836 RepID=A0A0L0D4Q5_THETB|nr:hypothetical protein AMSG_03739 [Thecamonas trahens ATCC 50062]KNC47304.1 hypothetical protein AMSG_03739 [Thecamonas trahens ATCC 50062]|eukprot:XP_013759645.1 hypothetical protein AMSG_03739 [Thecamonas trahens ATCC 50062]
MDYDDDAMSAMAPTPTASAALSSSLLRSPHSAAPLDASAVFAEPVDTAAPAVVVSSRPAAGPEVVVGAAAGGAAGRGEDDGDGEDGVGGGDRRGGAPDADASIAAAAALTDALLLGDGAGGSNGSGKNGAEAEVGGPMALGSAPANAATMVVAVVDPVKHGSGIDAFVSYKVQSRAAIHVGSEGGVTSVIRRYRDFLWLHDQLQATQPGIIVPPLPEKVALGRFHVDFIEHRRRELERFLVRLTRHAHIKTSSVLARFLADPDTLPSTKSKKADLVAAMRGFGRTLSALSGVSPATTIPGEADSVFTQQTALLAMREAQLAQLIHALESCVKRRRQMADAFDVVAGAAQELGASSAARSLSDDLMRFGYSTERLCVVYQEMTNNEIVFFVDALREYVRTIEAAKVALSSRAAAYNGWQSAIRAHQQAQTRLNRMAAAPEKYGDRVPEQRAAVEHARAAANEAKLAFDDISDMLESEFKRVERERIRDFRAALTMEIRTQVSHQTKVRNTWVRLLDELVHRGPEAAAAVADAAASDDS